MADEDILVKVSVKLSSPPPSAVPSRGGVSESLKRKLKQRLISQQLKRQRLESEQQQQQQAADSIQQPPTSSDTSSSSSPTSSSSLVASRLEQAASRGPLSPLPPLITSSSISSINDTFTASPHISNIVNNVVNNAVVTNNILVNAVNNVKPLDIKPNNTKPSKPKKSASPKKVLAKTSQKPKKSSPAKTSPQTAKSAVLSVTQPASLTVTCGVESIQTAKYLGEVNTAPVSQNTPQVTQASVVPKRSRPKANKKKNSAGKVISSVWPSAFTSSTDLSFVTSPSDLALHLSPPLNGLLATPPLSVKPQQQQQLDPEAISFIHRIYCRECQAMEEEKQQGSSEMTSTGGTTSPSSSSMSPPVPPINTPAPAGQPASPTSPLTSVEEQSLQQTMDINKESLKRKLMMRRSVSELRDQGIYPPLKTPPAFAEQSKHLERAKTGDFLSKKLQQRPDRLSLVQHHILEDSTASPSIQERQRMLKRARLQDSLSNSLAHRPGPLDLIQENILPVDNHVRTALQADGKIPFVTSHTDTSDDDGDLSSDGGISSPSNATVTESSDASSLPSTSPSPSLIPMPPDITPLLHHFGQSPGSAATSPPTFNFSQTKSPVTFTGNSGSVTVSSSALGGVSAPRSGSFSSNSSSCSSSTKANLNRIKKNKAKASTKSKVIKFHEYKGPSTVNKTAPTSPAASPSPSAEVGMDHQTAYQILLQQQQLFLQLQLESQQRSLPLSMPTAHQMAPVSLTTQAGGTTSVQVSSSITPLTSPSRFVTGTAVTGTVGNIKAPVALNAQSMSVQPVVMSSPQALSATKPLTINGQPIMISSFNGQPVTIGGRPVTFTPQPVSVRNKPSTVTSPPAAAPAKPTLTSTPKAATVNIPAIINTQAKPKPQLMNSVVKVEAKSSPEVKNEGMVVDDHSSSETKLPAASQVPPPPPLPAVSNTPQKDIKPTVAHVSPAPVESVQMVITANSKAKSGNARITLTPATSTAKCVTMTSGSTAASIAVPPGFKIVKLEEMKVPELKAELKKRNLTVSGSKPNLIERLKPHLGGDTLLISTAKQTVNKSSKAGKTSATDSGNASARTSEDAMLLGSPPMSPDAPAQPTSPCDMDVTSPCNLTANDDKTDIAMESKQPSRPSSVMPMDIDSSAETSLSVSQSAIANVDHNQNATVQARVITIQPQNCATTLTGSVYTTIPTSSSGKNAVPAQITLRPPLQATLQQHSLIKTQRTAASAAKPQQTAIVKPQKQTVDTVQCEKVALKPAEGCVQVQSPVKSLINVSVVTTPSVTVAPTPGIVAPPVGQPQVISHEELLRQQREQINQLVSQLQMSQRKLIDKEQALQEKTTELVAAQRIYSDREKLRIQLSQLQALSTAQGLNAQLLTNPQAFAQFQLPAAVSNTAVSAETSSPVQPAVTEVKSEPGSSPPVLHFTTSLPNFSDHQFVLTPKQVVLPTTPVVACSESTPPASVVTTNVLTSQSSIATPPQVAVSHAGLPISQTGVLMSQTGLFVTPAGLLTTKTVSHSTGSVTQASTNPAQAGTTALPSGTMPVTPSVTAAQPGVIPVPPGVTSPTAGVMAIHPGLMNINPTVMTTQPSLLGSQASMTVSQPSTVISQPSIVVSQPGPMTSQQNLVGSQSSVMLSQPDFIASPPTVMVSQPMVVMSQSGLVASPSVGMMSPSNTLMMHPGVFDSDMLIFTPPPPPVSAASTKSSSSLPGSPVADEAESQHTKLHRSATTPSRLTPHSHDLPNSTTAFKAPPNYQEAVKNKQNLLQNHTDNILSLAGKNNNLLKSSFMDDVLDILIKNGELPPDAAQEPPPTPKTTANQVISTNQVTGGGPVKSAPANSLGSIMGGDYVIVPNNGPSTVTSSWTASVMVTQAVTSPSISTTTTITDRSTSSPDVSSKIIDQMVFSPFISMDWDDDTDLAENLLEQPSEQSSGGNKDCKPVLPDSVDLAGMEFLSSPPSLSTEASLCTSQPDNVADMGMNVLGVTDCELGDDANAINMDWLDAIMPQTSLSSSPMTNTMTSTFSADPILTPKPQDVLDLFNIEESDLYLPSELGVGGFEKSMETASSSS